MSTEKNIVFDVVGTLATYDKLYQAIETTLGDRLRRLGTTVNHFGHLWLETCRKEFTDLMISGNYKTYPQVFETVLPRVLWQFGVPSPRTYVSPEDVATIIQGCVDMEFSADAVECIVRLRAAGFTVWGLTIDNRERVQGYFLKSGVEMPEENVRSCDSIGVAKPHPDAYKPTFQELSRGGSRPWFAAAHQWDTAAAMRVGFRGAYCTAHEGLALPELFGDMDVVADTLCEMAEKVIRETT